MKTFEIKNVDCKALDVDESSRRVKVALNKTGVKDHDNDIIEATAFDVTIRERGPQGKNLIWHLTDHYPSLKYAVGKFKELFMENGYLVGVTDIPNTTWGNDVMEFYKGGSINQHSIGFRTVKREIFNDDDWENRYCVIKEVTLYEGSAVLWGANEHTPTVSVGKSMNSQEVKSEFDKTMEELGGFHKMFKLGHLSDESYELIETRMNQLKSKLQQLFTYQPADTAAGSHRPADTAVSAESKDLLDVLKTFNQTLKTDDNGSERNSEAA